ACAAQTRRGGRKEISPGASRGQPSGSGTGGRQATPASIPRSTLCNPGTKNYADRIFSCSRCHSGLGGDGERRGNHPGHTYLTHRTPIAHASISIVEIPSRSELCAEV